jgi:transposase
MNTLSADQAAYLHREAGCLRVDVFDDQCPAHVGAITQCHRRAEDGGKLRPKVLLADRAYASRRHRAELRDRGITPKIAKRNTDNGSGLGTQRWVIERTFSCCITTAASRA